MPEERWVDNHEPSYSKAERSLTLTSRNMTPSLLGAGAVGPRQ